MFIMRRLKVVFIDMLSRRLSSARDGSPGPISINLFLVMWLQVLPQDRTHAHGPNDPANLILTRPQIPAPRYQARQLLSWFK
jgi:hypothetical protein